MVFLKPHIYYSSSFKPHHKYNLIIKPVTVSVVVLLTLRLSPITQ